MAKDAAQAVVWYRKAAKQGHAAAQNNLGVCFLEGNGVEQDAAQAWAWWEKAAELGVGAQTTPDIQLYSSLLIRHLLPSHNSTRKPSSIWE